MEAQTKKSIETAMRVAKAGSLIRNLQIALDQCFTATHGEERNHDLACLYNDLINEEFEEFQDEPIDCPNDMKELCDLIWVSVQYANAMGYDLELGMRELLKEYSSKFYDEHKQFHPTYNEKGKLLKGKGFKKADFDKFFEEPDEDEERERYAWEC